VQVVFAFDVAVHTTPRGAKAKPEFVSAALDTVQILKTPVPTSAQAAKPGEPKPKLEMETVQAIAVTVRNDGNKYLYLQNLDYVATGIDQAGNNVAIPSWNDDAIIDAAKVPLVSPGATRTVKLPLRGLPPLKSVDVRIRERAGI
jgi:fimbrial chaperone protein